MQLCNYFKLGLEQAGHLAGLGLERGRQHVGEELHSDGQQELHEGHHHKDQEGHQAEEVGADAEELDRQRARVTGEHGFHNSQRAAVGPPGEWTGLHRHPRGPTLGFQKTWVQGSPGRPVVRTPRSHCRGHVSDPWLGIYHPCCVGCGQKSLKRKGKAGWELTLYEKWDSSPAAAATGPAQGFRSCPLARQRAGQDHALRTGPQRGPKEACSHTLHSTR